MCQTSGYDEWTCSQWSALLESYARQSIHEDQAESLELHLQDCAQCLSQLSTILQGQVDPSPVVQFLDQLIGGIAIEAGSRDGVDHGLSRPAGVQGELIDQLGLNANIQSSLAPYPAEPAGIDEVSGNTKLTRYSRLRIAGAGGTGVVWEAWDHLMNRRVAIKVLLSEKVTSDQVSRLVLEASALARLAHPGIVAIYDLTEVQGRMAIVMEYISGTNLSEQLRGQPITEADAISLMIRVTAGIEHAHSQGVVHRDLKPSNLLITRVSSGTNAHSRLKDVDVKISDFGMARLLDQQTLTHSGQRLGTPAYMAPEQVCGAGAQISCRTDIYGLGVILYELLIGRPPFVADDPLVTMQMIRENAPVPLRMLQPNLSREIELICLKCLSKEPNDRYESANALSADLQALQAGRPIRARPVSGWIRGIRWMKRNRKLTLLGGVAVLAITSLLVESLLFAWAERQLRGRAELAEKKANERAIEAQDAVQQLKNQLLSSIGDLEFVLQYLEKNRVLNVNEVADTEHHSTIKKVTLEAYRKYLEFARKGSALELGDLAVAVNFVSKMQEFAPEQPLQSELEQIGECLATASPEQRADPWVRNAEAIYYQVSARDLKRRGELGKAVAEYLKMASLMELMGAAVATQTPQFAGTQRVQAIPLRNAAAVFTEQGDAEKAVETLRRTVAIYESLLTTEFAIDDDAIRLLDDRWELVKLLQPLDTTAAVREARAAVEFFKKYSPQDPATTLVLEPLFVRHQRFLDSLPDQGR